MTHSLFVTASGTDIGKTYVTTGLIRALREKDVVVEALKPLITDWQDATAADSDTGLILSALGHAVTPQSIERISPWRYKAALAPDMAAAREGVEVPYGDVISYCTRFAADLPDDAVFIVEGAGGVLVPVDDTHTMCDLMTDLSATPVLVVGSYLGTISHTLTALESLQARKLHPCAIVVSESADAGIPLEETCTALRRFTGSVPLIGVPRGSDTGFAQLADIVASA